MRRSLLALIAGIAVLALASLWAPARKEQVAQRSPTTPSPAPTPQQPAAPAPVPEHTSAPSPAPATPQPASAVPAPVEHHDAPALAPPSAFALQYAAMLEQRFQRDEASSSASLEAELKAKITAAIPAASRLESIECRAALCRVRSHHPDAETYQRFLEVFLSSDTTARIWPGGVWVAVPSQPPGAHTPITSSLYLARSAELPSSR